jgi:nucleoside phosphorylase
MPQMGKESSAIVAAGLRMSFMGVKVAFLVGVCGAAPVDPTPLDPKDREIFLGDVIISTAVIQVDFGRQYPDTFLRKDTLEDSPGRANSEIRAFLQKLKTKRTKRRLEEKMLKYVTGLGADDEYLYPAESSDNLYRSDYRHKHRDGSCQTCAGCNAPNDPVCDNARQAPCHELRCNDGPLVPRTRRTACPVLHFGRFASGDSVMKSGAHRDKIVAKDRVIAFEMEGAGTWDCLPTVIIKSACDYADSHKNKFWQSYASATAAACTKAVLDEWRNNQQ